MIHKIYLNYKSLDKKIINLSLFLRKLFKIS